MSWIKRYGEHLKYSFEKNALYAKPDPAYLFMGSTALASISFFAYKGIKEKSRGLPLLWPAFFCSATSGALFLIFALFNNPEIVITEKLCLPYSNVAIIAITGVVAFVLWILYILVHKVCNELRIRIDPEDKKNISAIAITIRELSWEFTLFCITQLVILNKWTSEKLKRGLQYIIQKFKDNRQKINDK